MELVAVDNLESLPRRDSPCVLTIGNFDGVHLGHQRILAEARRLARGENVVTNAVPPAPAEARRLADREQNVATDTGTPGGQATAPGVLPVYVVTFDPAPAALLRPTGAPPALLPRPLKYQLLGGYGADVVVVVQTTREFLATPPERFARTLAEHLRVKYLVEGPGFAFGAGRAATAQTLANLARRAGFEAVLVPPVEVQLPGHARVHVSSSLIRRLILDGDVVTAGQCLGRAFSLYGKVVSGEQRGRRLQFPTANIEPAEMIVPGDGVYAAWAQVGGAGFPACGGRRFPAAVSIGTKPTFGEKPRAIEANLIGADGDLYGQEMILTFLQRLRGQEKFPDASSLAEQIAKDVQRVRELCK